VAGDCDIASIDDRLSLAVPFREHGNLPLAIDGKKPTMSIGNKQRTIGPEGETERTPTRVCENRKGGRACIEPHDLALQRRHVDIASRACCRVDRSALSVDRQPFYRGKPVVLLEETRKARVRRRLPDGWLDGHRPEGEIGRTKHDNHQKAHANPLKHPHVLLAATRASFNSFVATSTAARRLCTNRRLC